MRAEVFENQFCSVCGLGSMWVSQRLVEQALIEVGVAQWVDKWLVDTGRLQSYLVSDELRNTLLEGQPVMKRSIQTTPGVVTSRSLCLAFVASRKPLSLVTWCHYH
eukprot:2803886-Amphidinium_carterae.1